MSNFLSPHPTSTPQQSKESQINVFELTLLLKVMGFRLNYLDYEESSAEKSQSEITVEIRCGKRNIFSRLSASSDLCSCPPKNPENGHDSSFWEILGTAPSSSPGRSKIEDTSSNLLPELSKRGISNTKHLLALIYDGFHKDHLPSTTNTSPEQGKDVPTSNPNILTSTAVAQSPRRLIPIYNEDLLRAEDHFDAVSSGLLSVPPNTPKVGGIAIDSTQMFRNRDHSVYLELKAAKDRLEKALLFMKINIAGELGDFHGPAMNLCTNKQIFEEPPAEVLKGNGMSPGTFKRRSSLGAFPNIKSRIDTGGVKKKTNLVRNKSSVDTAAAHKAKSAVSGRAQLLPRKPFEHTLKKVSPLARTTSAAASTRAAQAKRSPAQVGMGTWK